MDRLVDLVAIAPARRAGDPGSNPGPGEHFSLKLLIYIYIRYYRLIDELIRHRTGNTGDPLGMKLFTLDR